MLQSFCKRKGRSITEASQNAALTVKKLIDKKMKITFAESCTGGLAAAELVAVPDASKVFDGSFVTYAEKLKTALVGVPAADIEKYGVVSTQVAEKMASGCAERLNCEVGVGITGYAGPTGGTENAPVGTVCFGFYVNGAVKSFTKHFGSIGRNEVRRQSVEFVFATLCDILE